MNDLIQFNEEIFNEGTALLNCKDKEVVVNEIKQDRHPVYIKVLIVAAAYLEENLCLAP